MLLCRVGNESRLSSVLFRFRALIILAIVLLGFWSPWDAWFGWRDTRVWLEIPQQLARVGWLHLEPATVTVTIAAVALASIAALLRVWGTAYLGGATVIAAGMQAGRLMADGPYRRVRNPLYVGTMFHMLAIAVLMPVSGAIWVIVGIAIVQAALVAGEERFLLASRGEEYAAYMRAVPRWIPALRAKVPAMGTRPRWGEALLGEAYIWAVAVIFAALAWRYNAQLMERGVLIAFGVRLILRALAPWQKTDKEAEKKTGEQGV